MISNEDCMALILQKVPDFEFAWLSHLEFWGDDEAGLSNDISEFSSYLISNFESISNDNRREIFLLIEDILNNGDNIVKDATATCLLENIINAASSGHIDPQILVNLMGLESKKYCKSWDEFTGNNNTLGEK